RYGVPDAPRFVPSLDTKNGRIVELPVSTLRLGSNWPAGGGVYFRFLPYPFIRRMVQRINKEEQPAVLYVHPWEMDPEQPVPDGLHPLFKARRYLNLDKTEGKWRALLRDFEFGPIGEVFGQELGQESDV
ncbi:MAG: DUF3473 domain-containing protein, partial [bacterium]|nr:DUF3473 domain-containing protein [bacterium]